MQRSLPGSASPPMCQRRKRSSGSGRGSTGLHATAPSRPAWSSRPHSCVPAPQPLDKRAEDAGEPLIDVHDVHYAIGTHRIFTGLNVQVAKGSITAIMGPSGTGKTTLLRLI